MLKRLAQEYRKTGDQAAEADALRRLMTAFPNAPDSQAARARLQSLQTLLKTASAQNWCPLTVVWPRRQSRHTRATGH